MFRLFYHASSFEVASTGNFSGLNPTSPQEAVTKVLEDVHNEKHVNTSADLPQLFKTFNRFSTQEWLTTILADHPKFETLKVNSITWVKALASPFSHEFTQFIVEDTQSGQRTRLAAGREENGDWVLVGWDWASGDSPSEHYKLPLPLLSVTFDNPTTKPALVDLARVLASTTQEHPAYKFRREMCWWYAEYVLEVTHEQFGGKIKEWEWARYRYSFVVKTSLIRRKVLTRCAEVFRKQLAEEMHY